MKKIIFFLSLFLLSTSVLAHANSSFTSGKSGIYVAPKFLFGGQFASVAWMNANDRIHSGMGSFGFDDLATSLGFAIGYDFSTVRNGHARMELEYLHFFEKTQSGTFQNSSKSLSYKVKSSIDTLFFNYYYDIYTNMEVAPYLGFGLGLAWNSFEVSNIKTDISTVPTSLSSDNKTNIATNFAVGASYAIDEQKNIDFSLRYIVTGEGKTKSFTGLNNGDYIGSNGTINFLVLAIGLRYVF